MFVVAARPLCLCHCRWLNKACQVLTIQLYMFLVLASSSRRHQWWQAQRQSRCLRYCTPMTTSYGNVTWWYTCINNMASNMAVFAKTINNSNVDKLLKTLIGISIRNLYSTTNVEIQYRSLLWLFLFLFFVVMWWLISYASCFHVRPIHMIDIGYISFNGELKITSNPGDVTPAWMREVCSFPRCGRHSFC